MNRLFLHDVRLEAKVGIYKRERVTSQPIALDLDIELPTDRMLATGKVADTIDYAVVVARVRAELEERRFGLVEELADFVAQLVLNEFHPGGIAMPALIWAFWYLDEDRLVPFAAFALLVAGLGRGLVGGGVAAVGLLGGQHARDGAVDAVGRGLCGLGGQSSRGVGGEAQADGSQRVE